MKTDTRVLIKHKLLTSNILLFYKKSAAKTKLPPKLTNLQEFLEPHTIVSNCLRLALFNILIVNVCTHKIRTLQVSPLFFTIYPLPSFHQIKGLRALMTADSSLLFKDNHNWCRGSNNLTLLELKLRAATKDPKITPPDIRQWLAPKQNGPPADIMGLSLKNNYVQAIS